jgi:hypothetical protein
MDPLRYYNYWSLLTSLQQKSVIRRIAYVRYYSAHAYYQRRRATVSVREIEEMDGITYYEGRVFKRPATPLGGRHRETREIERHQDSKRDLQKRVISQQGNELPASTRQQNRQSNKATDTAQLTAEQQSTRQRTQPSTRQQNRQSTRQRTQPSTRQQNRQSTRERVQSQESRITENATVCKSEINKETKKPKPECLEDDRQGPRNLQRYNQTRQSARRNC